LRVKAAGDLLLQLVHQADLFKRGVVGDYQLFRGTGRESWQGLKAWRVWAVSHYSSPLLIG
jgi:hypothetical protein